MKSAATVREPRRRPPLGTQKLSDGLHGVPGMFFFRVGCTNERVANRIDIHQQPAAGEDILVFGQLSLAGPIDAIASASE